MVTSALKSILAIAEAYPQLRAVENFVKLQDELSTLKIKFKLPEDFITAM